MVARSVPATRSPDREVGDHAPGDVDVVLRIRYLCEAREDMSGTKRSFPLGVEDVAKVWSPGQDDVA